MKLNNPSKKKYLGYLTIFAVILVLVVAAIALRNKILLNRWVNDYQIQKAQFAEFKQNIQKIEEALIKAQSASMIHLGTTLKLENMKKIFPVELEKGVAPVVMHPRLLLVFSELSCNVCQDAETQFGISIANDYGQDYVMAVVYASQRQYVANYVRLNQVNFPVFYLRDETFFKENGIKNTPMIFVIDEENRVIASHFPLPGHLEYSKPIHRFCFHYFNKSIK